MNYILIILIIATGIFLLLSNHFRRNRKRLLQRIRDNYGKPKNEYFNFDKIAIYLESNSKKYFQKLSPQTISDIDVQEAFSFIDRTSSKIGQQYLYDKFCKPTNNLGALQNFHEQVIFFQRENKEREQSQLLLYRLSNDDAYSVATLLRDTFPEKPKWFPLLYLNLFALTVLLLLSVKFPVLLLWAFIPAAVNIFISIWNKAKALSFAKPLLQLNLLIKIAEKLQQRELPIDDAEVSDSLKALHSFRRKMRYIVFERDNTLDELAKMAMFVFEIIRNIFAVEVLVFNALLKDVMHRHAAIHTLFKYVGEIDASISVASLRQGLNNFCTPLFTHEKKELVAKKMFHPLIEECIPNDFCLSEKSVLITGSNMSGKTTFLRTIALNTLAAQTIYTCFAGEFSLPFVKIFSSIRIDDDLLQGKSYYLEEVNIIKVLTDAASEPVQNLFVLDEVFKGTNTAERIALAKAVLTYLNRKNNIVFVATHDLELADMLSEEYELFHFSENIENGKMQFDHHIKQGKLTSTNAIQLVELAGLPASVVNEAKSLKQRLQH